MRSFQILVEVYRKFCWEISVMGSDEVFLLSEQRFSVFKTLVLASHNIYMIANCTHFIQPLFWDFDSTPDNSYC